MHNDDADQLTNMVFQHFDPKKRIPVSLGRLGFQVLPELFEAGEKCLETLNRLKAESKESEKLEGNERAKKRLRGNKGLRERDPW